MWQTYCWSLNAAWSCVSPCGIKSWWLWSLLLYKTRLKLMVKNNTECAEAPVFRGSRSLGLSQTLTTLVILTSIRELNYREFKWVGPSKETIDEGANWGLNFSLTKFLVLCWFAWRCLQLTVNFSSRLFFFLYFPLSNVGCLRIFSFMHLQI